MNKLLVLLIGAGVLLMAPLALHVSGLWRYPDDLPPALRAALGAEAAPQPEWVSTVARDAAAPRTAEPAPAHAVWTFRRRLDSPPAGDANSVAAAVLAAAHGTLTAECRRLSEALEARCAPAAESEVAALGEGVYQITARFDLWPGAPLWSGEGPAPYWPEARRIRALSPPAKGAPIPAARIPEARAALYREAAAQCATLRAETGSCRIAQVSVTEREARGPENVELRGEVGLVWLSADGSDGSSVVARLMALLPGGGDGDGASRGSGDAPKAFRGGAAYGKGGAKLVRPSSR